VQHEQPGLVDPDAGLGDALQRDVVLGDIGGAYSIPLVQIGASLGLYKALNDLGPMTAEEMARHTDLSQRYLREWLAHQAASGYITYDGATGRFALPPENAMVFAMPDSPVYLVDAFESAGRALGNRPMVEAAFKTGKGVGWDHQEGCLFCAIARFFRPGELAAARGLFKRAAVPSASG